MCKVFKNNRHQPPTVQTAPFNAHISLIASIDPVVNRTSFSDFILPSFTRRGGRLLMSKDNMDYGLWTMDYGLWR
jgi:hypothetical protein